MSSFEQRMDLFAQKIDAKARAILLEAAMLAHQSIQTGSPLTGAPGQPVDTGYLRASWQLVPDGPDGYRITTNAAYARQIEDGTRLGRALTLRSAVGGFHSVKLTRNAWPRIVEAATRSVAGA